MADSLNKFMDAGMQSLLGTLRPIPQRNPEQEQRMAHSRMNRAQRRAADRITKEG